MSFTPSWGYKIKPTLCATNTFISIMPSLYIITTFLTHFAHPMPVSWSHQESVLIFRFPLEDLHVNISQHRPPPVKHDRWAKPFRVGLAYVKGLAESETTTILSVGMYILLMPFQCSVINWTTERKAITADTIYNLTIHYPNISIPKPSTVYHALFVAMRPSSLYGSLSNICHLLLDGNMELYQIYTSTLEGL